MDSDIYRAAYAAAVHAVRRAGDATAVPSAHDVVAEMDRVGLLTSIEDVREMCRVLALTLADRDSTAAQ